MERLVNFTHSPARICVFVTIALAALTVPSSLAQTVDILEASLDMREPIRAGWVPTVQ